MVNCEHGGNPICWKCWAEKGPTLRPDELERGYALRDAVAYTLRNGGGTFERDTLRPVQFHSGYAVAVAPHETRTISVDAFDGEIVSGIWNVIAATGAPYIGTWIDGDDNIVIDAVAVLDNLADALEIGRALGQDAVYGFGEGDSIPC